MKGNFIEFQDHDFEFAKAPISKQFIIAAFEEHFLSFISYFGGDFFYVEMQDGEPLIPINLEGSYPEKIELIFDFMVTERISLIRYENGVLLKGSVMGESSTSDA
ncbi:hypothetical protein V7O66_06505 [Methanolobus sp. ZRKC3]|uniref:hypothetical protein n=1 Tax=Methanolobus sp. ZRKC3 TaxID=3125786 RepID=UPI00324DD3B3